MYWMALANMMDQVKQLNRSKTRSVMRVSVVERSKAAVAAEAKNGWIVFMAVSPEMCGAISGVGVQVG
jgi:hypothetical protein